MQRPGPLIAAVSLVGLAAMSIWLAFAPPPPIGELTPFSGEVITLEEGRGRGHEREWQLTLHSFPPALHHDSSMPGFHRTAAEVRAGTWVTGLAEWVPGRPAAICWALRTDTDELIDYEQMLDWYRGHRGLGMPWLLVLVAAGALALAGWTLFRRKRTP